jgi:hypothetical protein
VTAVIAGCAGPISPPPHRAAPATYLLGVDQMVSPDFSVDTAPHAVSATDIAGTDHSTAQQLTSAGLVSAAGEDLFRDVGSLALANGPVQVRDTVEEFQAADGAATVYGSDVSRLDAVKGATAVSTGSLGDAAHATTTTATAADGVKAVEITLEWRVGNLVDILVVRGRAGATRPDDALLLAHRQTVIELGLATPSPRATPS